jgi:hypothetical protein
VNTKYEFENLAAGKTAGLNALSGAYGTHRVLVIGGFRPGVRSPLAALYECTTMTASAMIATAIAFGGDSRSLGEWLLPRT